MRDLFYLIVLFPLVSFTQETVFEDSIKNKDKFNDLSTLLLWGGNSQPVSAFEILNKTDDNNLSLPSLSLTSSAINKGGYSSGSAYTSTAIDYTFDAQTRSGEFVYALEFDYLSALLSGSGESGRLGIALLYDYPAEGPQFNDVYSDEKAPFGRPSYNLRLLNGTVGTKQAYLFYGGGKDTLGEFEKQAKYLLPG
ncbi:MAG: hypothetical protein HC906_02385, partial [Bacteroidales bacterium]|nr:hypothetical protein [Bacteroidales bacterium]